MKYNKSKVLITCGSFDITKREVLASVSIVAVLLLIGILISSKISERQMDKNEVYNKAVKIESVDMFKYGMRTNVGNAFVYGDLTAVDTVSYPEIDGEYMYIEKVKEEYTMHTRQVAHTRTVNGKSQTYYTTETYWTWDRVGSEDLKCKEISFCDNIFDSSKINLPGTNYINTVNISSHTRYVFYGVGTQYKGTIFTYLQNNTISDSTNFYNNKTIDETVEYLTSGASVIVFWILWSLFIIGCILVFCIMENKWLE